MLPRKPVDNVIAIDSVAFDPVPLPPNPANVCRRKKSRPDYALTRRTAMRRFFLGSAGVWKVHRETGLPTRIIENELREIGFAEWERRNGRAA